MTRRAGMTPKLRGRLTGIAFLLVMVLLAWLSIAAYNKEFTPVAMVTLDTGSAGNEMSIGAQVMVRGVAVGEVRGITADGSGAQLQLAIQPSEVPDLPANVSAEMMPTTLFGERYVDLILPSRPAAARLTAGTVIHQDRAADAVELENVLGNLFPLLNAVEPDQLSVTLTAIAQGLAGRGAELGRTLVTLSSSLHQLNPQLPTLDTDIKELAGVARSFHQAAPQIVQALNDFTLTSETVAHERASLAALFSTVTTAATDLHQFLAANSANTIGLSTDSLATLNILARYSPEFPCTLSALAKFVPNMNKVLGQGTKQHGFHVQITVTPEYATGAYRAGKDTPVYDDNLGPHCYRAPFPGITLHDGTTPLTAANSAGSTAAGAEQSEIARELASLTLRRPEASLPSWTSLLLGPLFHGTVTVAVSRA